MQNPCSEIVLEEKGEVMPWVQEHIQRSFSKRPSHVGYIPAIKEITVPIKNLKVEDRFINPKTGSHFMVLPGNGNGCRAICYLVGKNDVAGEVYLFSPNEPVVWLKTVYVHNCNGHHKDKEFPIECCQQCGTKLESDSLSDRYGDWCPNPDCN